MFCLSIAADINAKDRHMESKNDLVIYFKSETFEIEKRSLDILFNNLDPNMFYTIQGYSCSSDIGSKKELLTQADKRAEIVKEHLIRKGFPADKLTTTVYDQSTECKVTLSIVE